MAVDCIASTVGLVDTIVHLWPVLAGSTSLDLFLDHAFECTDAHASLTMTSQSVMTSEGVAAETWVWFRTCVNLGMSLEVVSSDEALLAVVAAELSVTKVRLNMRFYILLAAELLVAVIEFASPLLISGIWAFDELCNVVKVDIGLLDRGLNAWLEVEI